MVLTREEAKQTGLKTYFTGKPCKRGHIGDRQVSNGTCMQCSNHRAKEIYTRNPEKFKQRVKEYRLNDVERYKQRKREHWSKLDEQSRLRHNAKRATRLLSDAPYRNNLYESAREYRSRNPEKIRALRLNYQARRRGGGDMANPEEIAFLHRLQDHRCFYCEEPYSHYHVDHMIPLSRGGTNDISNLAIACPTCNLRKHAKMPWVFLAENKSRK